MSADFDVDRTLTAVEGKTAALKTALKLALCWLSLHEPQDSRAVSDEFVAMASVEAGLDDAECLAIIERGIETFKTSAHARRGPAVLVISPEPVSTYRHVTRGGVYAVTGTGTAQGPIPDNEPVTIYHGEDGRVWVRGTAQFHDGRFVKTE